MQTPLESRSQFILALVGPTAVGKTRISLDIAPRLDAEIVSVDSMQVYRGMDIGTDKPSPEERRRVRHHLIDVVSPYEPFTVAAYQELARSALADIRRRGKLPFLVGGSGLYFQAVADKLEFPDFEPDAAQRQRLENDANADPQALVERLRQVDPVSAEAIPAGNLRRVVRALEVWELTGKPYSEYQGGLFAGSPGLEVIAVGVEAEREVLAELIQRRVRSMLARGLVDEVRELREGGKLGRTASQGLGYRQILEFLDSDGDLEETSRKIEQGTRRLAKRQRTWFKRDSRIVWFKPEDTSSEALEDMEKSILLYFQRELQVRNKEA